MDFASARRDGQSQRKYILLALAFLLGSGVAWYVAGRSIERTNFLPHWFCYLGNPALVITHFSTDVIIGISYVAISLTLGYIAWRTHGSIPLNWMVLAFGTFIIACGATHFVEAITLWKPIYWFSAYMKVITASASLATAITLPFTIPVIESKIRDVNLSAQHKRDLESANQQLEQANVHLAELAAELRHMGELKARFFAHEAADVGDWHWDLATGKVTWSREVEIVHGVPIGTFGGSYQDWANTVHPNDLEATVAKLTKAREERGDYDVEYRTKRTDGSWHWTASRGRFIYNSVGEPTRLIGVSMDVTARHEAQQQTQSQARALDLANDAIIVTDHAGKIISWNRGAERLYGWSRDEVIGQPVTPLLNTTFPKSRTEIQTEMEQRGEWQGELHHITKDGEEIIVASRFTLERDAQGHPQGWVEINRDITRQKKSEEVLRRSEKLAAAGRLAATIAHEINNPLEAVTNLIYIARSEPRIPEETRILLKEAETQLGRVSHIARKTLGFYRDSSRPIMMNLEKLLDEILSVYAARLQSRNIQLLRQYDDAFQVEAVPGELIQVFSNLIANAIDASPLGGRLAVRVRKASSGPNRETPGILVIVADSGTGIPSENRQRIFEPFFTTKKDVGTGLGLWVAAELIRKHNGWIRVRSSTTTARRGTTFAVFLPAAQSSEVRTASVA